MKRNEWRSDAPMTEIDRAQEQREIDRARELKRSREAENDAKLERHIRIAMAAKEDTAGNCFYCGKPLEIDGDVKLHPMPYLDCKGPPTVSPVPLEYIRQAAGLPKLPDIKPVRRMFGERDDD
jgi:hypothetical protein